MNLSELNKELFWKQIKFHTLRYLYEEKNIHHETTLWCLSGIIIVSASVLLAWKYPSNSWFERSGSILVILGIISSYRGLTRSFNRIFWKVEDEILRYGEELKQLKKDSETEKLPTLAIYLEQLDTFAEFLHKNKQKILEKSRKIELALIVLGTFIWGYGGFLQS